MLGVGVVLLTQLGQTTDPDDVSVTGFGSTADTELFIPVAETFSSIGCIEYLNIGEIYSTDYLPLYKLIVSAPNFTVTTNTNIGFVDELVKSCDYDLEDGRKITFNIYGYDPNSIIPDSREELYEGVKNDKLANILDENSFRLIRYFYGTDVSNNSICNSLIFQFQNEFRYANITYSGFDNCSDLIGINRVLTDNFGKKIEGVMASFALSEEYLKDLDPANYDITGF